MEAAMKDARCVSPGFFRLCFRSLFDSGRGYAFPCDSHGCVDLNALSEQARNNYLYARAMVGRELSQPAVEPADRH
jgi:hypothetical protein